MPAYRVKGTLHWVREVDANSATEAADAVLSSGEVLTFTIDDTEDYHVENMKGEEV